MGDGFRLSSHQLLDLNSFHFVLLSACAVLAVRAFRAGPLRTVSLAAFNLYFLAWFIAGWVPLLVTVGLIVGSYLIGKAGLLRERLNEWVPTLGVLLLWAFLFLVKDPDLLPWINPFHRYPIVLFGISYIVFRCIQFIMDGEIFEDADLPTFFNYVLFFPTLMAGPIERYERFEQFHRGQDCHYDEPPLPSLHRIVTGFLKKFVLADNLAAFALSAKGTDESWPVPMLWLGLLLQPVILYWDFSGYCDIMIGLVRLMGFRLSENFDAPWKAQNIQDFWNRWHITLSHFVRDYVFNPLSRHIYYYVPRGWQFGVLMGLYFFTMQVIALWHATTWNFLIFGVAHGTMLVGVQVLQKYVYPQLPPPIHAFWMRSPVSLNLARAFNWVFIALTISLWTGGLDRTVTLLHQLLGGS